MKNYLKILLPSGLIISIFLLLGNFSFAHAANKYSPNETDPAKANFQLVPECHGDDGKGGEGKEAECGWKDLIVLGQRVMVFLLFIAGSLATLSFAYAGFLYITAFGESGKVERAKTIFSTVALGLLFTFGGFLLIATILKTLGVDNAFSLVNFSNVTAVDKNTGK